MLRNVGAGPAARQAGVLALVVVAHLGIIVAFLSGLGARAVQLKSAPLQVSIIDQRRPLPPPPPVLPIPQLRVLSRAPTFPDVPLPVINIPSEAPPAPTSPLVPPDLGLYVPLALLSRDTEAYYPRDASRRHLSGQTLTRVCIDSNAHVAKAQVVQSSGHPELDAAALMMIQHARWQAATLDGKPITDCRPLLVNFILRSQR